MSYSNTTLAQLRDGFVAEVEGSLSTDIPALPISVTRIFGTMYAAGVMMIRHMAGWNLLQQYAEFASFKEYVIAGKAVRPLVAIGNAWGVSPPHEATRAIQMVSLSVTNQTGSLPANTPLTFSGNSFVYLTRTAVALNAATVQVEVEAVSGPGNNLGVGADGTVPIGSKLQFISPQSKVLRDAIVLATISAGQDAELEASYRKRVLDKRRRPPQGGSYADYYHWALDVSGIVAAYPYVGLPGRIEVYIEATVESSGSPDGIPTNGQRDAVQAYIDAPARKPASDGLSVLKISRSAIDVVVNGLVVENRPVVEIQIGQALDQHFRTREPYIEGLSTPPRADLITQPTVAAVVMDVVQAYGGTVFSVVAPAYQKLDRGQKAKLGTLTFVS